MESIVAKMRASETTARVAPFIIFAALTSLQGMLGEDGRYWVYAAKLPVGIWALWAVWPVVPEMRWKVSWDAVVAGILVFVIWVGLDPFYPKIMTPGQPWNPHNEFPAGLAWFFVVVRILGSTLVVPPLEEVFYRSFVYRWIVNPNFGPVSLKQFHWGAFLITSTLFGLVHFEWLAGILCGMIYQLLVIRHGRLGEAMTAHAITNFLLGLWVVYKGAWQFW